MRRTIQTRKVVCTQTKSSHTTYPYIPNLEQVSRMLDKAFQKFPYVEGLIMHSDQGRQYPNSYYIKELEKHKITQSMSKKGNCYDNCIMEIFFGD